MSDNQHDHGEVSSWNRWFLLMLLSPMFYVLSIGPAGALVEHGMLPREPIGIVYFPVIWLARNTPLGWIIMSYLSLWGAH